jgi:hypothetical protein
MLELDKLRKVYSGIPVVEEVSFTARGGENHGLSRCKRFGQIDNHEDGDWTD